MFQYANLVVAMVMAAGQAEQPDEVKSLNWIIGNWEASMEAGDDAPDAVAPGEKILVHVSFAGILNGTKIEWALRTEANKKALLTAKALIGLDNDRQFKGWWFDSDGRVSVTKWSRSGQIWTMDTEDDSTWVMEQVDKDTWTHKRTRREGQNVANPAVITYKRVAGQTEAGWMLRPKTTTSLWSTTWGNGRQPTRRATKE